MDPISPSENKLFSVILNSRRSSKKARRNLSLASLHAREQHDICEMKMTALVFGSAGDNALHGQIIFLAILHQGVVRAIFFIRVNIKDST
jgi:hypothetical protein